MQRITIMKTDEASPTDFKPYCRHLRSKEMYYQAPGQEDDEFSSGVYWCGKTNENFGPDGEPCSKAECCSGRACCLI